MIVRLALTEHWSGIRKWCEAGAFDGGMQFGAFF
jgi:hypothetical protein